MGAIAVDGMEGWGYSDHNPCGKDDALRYTVDVK